MEAVKEEGWTGHVDGQGPLSTPGPGTSVSSHHIVTDTVIASNVFEQQQQSNEDDVPNAVPLQTDQINVVNGTDGPAHSDGQLRSGAKDELMQPPDFWINLIRQNDGSTDPDGQQPSNVNNMLLLVPLPVHTVGSGLISKCEPTESDEEHRSNQWDRPAPTDLVNRRDSPSCNYGEGDENSRTEDLVMQGETPCSGDGKLTMENSQVNMENLVSEQNALVDQSSVPIDHRYSLPSASMSMDIDLGLVKKECLQTWGMENELVVKLEPLDLPDCPDEGYQCENDPREISIRAEAEGGTGLHVHAEGNSDLLKLRPIKLSVVSGMKHSRLLPGAGNSPSSISKKRRLGSFEETGKTSSGRDSRDSPMENLTTEGSPDDLNTPSSRRLSPTRVVKINKKYSDIAEGSPSTVSSEDDSSDSSSIENIDVKRKTKGKKHGHAGERRYACGTCGEKFALASAIREHVSGQKGHKAKYSCSMCGFIVRSPCELEKHLARRKHNPQEGVEKWGSYNSDGIWVEKAIKLENKAECERAVESRFACGTCGERFPLASVLLEHLSISHVHEPKHKCSACGRIVRSRSELEKHLKICRPVAQKRVNYMSSKRHQPLSMPGFSIQKPYGCITCRQKFPHIGDLKKHLDSSDKHKPRHQCNICGRICRAWRDFQKHMERHETGKLYQCDKCGYSTLYWDTFSVHVCVKSENSNINHFRSIRPYGCMTCGETFVHLSALREHMREFKEHRPRNQCTICQKVCRSWGKFNLKQHMTVHETGNPHQCDRCGRGFESENNLKTHLRRHMATRDKPCLTCGKLFKLESDLRGHINKVHTDVKRCLCPVCGKAFKEKSHLNNHLATHGDDTPFPCSLCDKRYKTKTSLTNHVKTHYPKERVEPQHQCFICGKRFRTPTVLDTHMECHSEDKPFACEFCGKRFKRRHNLGSHKRTHMETRDFKCDVCGQEFKWAHILRNHMKRHESKPIKMTDE